MTCRENKAVFLSYASQDAEAARRICDALRAAGVEVWFDQSELVGGDAWDAKIRKQIKECALFVPVISAATQARLEGYFRIEWKLAAQRTHAMAEEKAFLLPVVIDDTRDSDAKVPAEFRAVQWTRLWGGAADAVFTEQVQKLRDRGTEPAPESSPARPSAAASETARTVLTRRPPQWRAPGMRAVVAIALCGLVAFVAWTASRPPAGKVSRTAPQQNDLDDSLVSLLRKSREDSVLAEEATRALTEQQPQSAEAWAARGYVQAVYLIRSWDNSDRRRQDAQAFARRALSLEANNGRALFVLGTVLIDQGAFAEAETIARRALAARPDDLGGYRVLAIALVCQNRADEALSLLEAAAARLPNTRFDYIIAQFHQTKAEPDLEAALRHYEALKPNASGEAFVNVLLHKAALLVGARGDFAGAREILDQVSPLDRMEDRAVGTAMTLALLERHPAQVVSAGGLTARDYFEDMYIPGPKAWCLAHARRIDGKQVLMRDEWQNAEAVLRRRLAKGTNAADTAALAVTLAWLDRAEEAAKLIAPIEASVRESPPWIIGLSPDQLRLLYLAYYYAGLGDATQAVPYIRQLLNRRELLTHRTLPLDPWWDRLRGKPEFEALLAEAAARRAEDAKLRSGANLSAAPASEVHLKSVAVLAFRPGSVDRENDLLCEAIPDELCNVLGQVPGLRVAASASAFSFKGKGARLRDIAAQLGVAYLVDGTVVKVGNRVRVRAELFRAADEMSVWKSGDITHELKDMFAVGDEIVPAIARNLQLQLGASPRAAKAVTPEAYALYQTGRQQWNLRHEAAYVQAEAAFTRAVELDPQFALGYAGLADVWLLRGARALEAGEPSDDLLKKAESFARRALQMDPDRPDPHATLGNLHMFRGEKAASRAAFERALAINESYATAHHWFALSLFRSGRIDLARRHALRAVEADPLSRVLIDVAIRLNFAAGAYREVERFAERRQLMPPNSAAEHVNVDGLVWRARHRLDRSAEAAAWAARVVAAGDGSTGLMADALIVLAETGWPDEAAQGLKALRRRDEADPGVESPRRRDNRPALLAPVLAALGRNDEAIAAAAATISTPFGVPREKLLYDPVWNPLRNDPRFQAVLVKLNAVEDYQTARETLARLRNEEAKR